MANLLSWGNNQLQKKKNELAEPSLINRLQTSVQNARVVNQNPKTEIAYATKGNQVTNPANQTIKTSTFNAGTRKYNPTQQTVQQKTFRPNTFSLNNNFNQFNAKSQNQTEQEQKQSNLLQSSMNGKSLLSNLSDNNNFTNFRRNLEAARVNNQNPKTETAFASEGAEGYKKYYDEEFKKISSKQNFFERLMDQGTASRQAEVAARNRYQAELMNKAFDDNGNVKNQSIADMLAKQSKENMQIAQNYNEAERAKSRMIGASADSDTYGDDLGKKIQNVFNVIRSSDLGSAVVGADDTSKFDLSDVLRFGVNTGQYAIPVAGWSQGILRGAPSVAEALTGTGKDKETGNYKQMDLAERLGRGVSGAIDVAGPKFGASEKLASTIMNLATGGAKEVGKQAAKQGVKGILKQLAQGMLSEGIEEGVQEIGDYFGDGGKLTDENGKFSAEKLGELAAQAGQAAALGALGGGLMSGANVVVGKTANAVNNRRANTAIGTNINEDINLTERTNQNLNENINEEVNIEPSRVQTAEDGNMVKTNTDGTTTRLSNAELASVIDNGTTPRSNVTNTTQNTNTVQNTEVSGVNPFQDNAVNVRSSAEDVNSLASRAAQGDTYAQQRLAEITGQNQAEDTGWRGKSVDEVINPETTNQDAEQQSLLKELSDLWGGDEDTRTETKPKYDSRASDQKLVDVVEGKLSIDDYLAEQRELMWQSFKDSNRGVESYLLKQDPNSNDYTRRVTESSNGSLYRMLYDEYGGRPTKTAFNEALNDVLANGENSKYYAAFKEFDPTGDYSIYGFNQGNEGIDMVLDLQRYMAEQEATRTPEQRVYDAQTPKGEVSTIADVINTPTGKNSFVTLLRGASNRVRDVIKNAIGVDVSGYNHTMDSSSVKHALNKHANDSIPLKVEDFNLIPDIIKNADSIEYSGKNRRGLDTITYAKQYDNKIAYVEEVRNGRHQLVMNTMYWEGKGQQKSTPTGEFSENISTNSERASSRPVGSVDSSISRNGENVKQSKFASETVQKSKEVSDELKTKMKKTDNSYQTTSNAERVAKSEEFMKSRSLSEAESDIINRVVNQKVGKISDQDVSDAIAVVKALDAKGDNASLERATVINNSLSEHMTKKGQEIQALSLLNNRTPEGLRYGAEKAIQKGGTEITPEIHKKVLADTDKIVKARSELSNAQKAFDNISKEATTLYSRENKRITKSDYKRIMDSLATTGRRLEDANYNLEVSYANMSKTVADNTKQTVGNIYTSIHKAGLLSAPTTHIRNIASNGTFHMMNKVSDAGAAAIDNMISLITGKRTKTFTMRGEGKGLAQGLRYGLETMKTGIDELNGAGGKYTSGFPELRFKNKFADFVIGKPNRIIFRAMSAGDKPFRYQTQANSLYDQAIAQAKTMGLKGKGKEIFIKQFVTDPPEAALTKAVADGEKAVLGQDNMVAKLVNTTVKKLENSDSLGARALGNMLDAHVVPFVKVPTNFLIESANYTPIGTAKEAFKLLGDGIHGKGFDQRAFVESISKSAIGTTALIGLGKMLADNFTGEYPEEEAERNRWEAEGIKENAVKIGDRYYPLDTFGPAALLIGAGAQFWKSISEGDSAMDAAGESLGQFARNLGDQSFLSGVSEVVDLFQGKATANTLTNYIKQEVASEIPNVSKKLAAALDPYARSTGKKSDVGSQVIAQLMNSIPGLRTLLPAKVDNYGNDLKNGAFITGFLDPTSSGAELQKGNAIVEEVARLHNAAGDLDLTDEEKKEFEITPSDVDYKFGAKGSEVQLSDDEQRELTKMTGQLISSTWQKTMDSDDYKNSDDLRKARLLMDARKAAVNLAKQQFADKHGYTAPKMTTDAKNLANGTYTASAKNSDGSSSRSNSIEINDKLDDNYKSILNQYNSMSSDDWKEYTYGTNADQAAAEYNLAVAKYKNDVENGEVSATQKIKREKELAKLEVSQKWTKDYRDAYSLASNKSDMQAYLDGLDDENRAQTVSVLNGLNKAMLDAGIISESTYKTRWRAINNVESSSKRGSSSKKSSGSDGISSAEASAWASLAKTMADGDSGVKVKTTSAPTTNRKLNTSTSSGSSSGKLATYSPKTKNSISVSKDAKRAIV